MGRYTTTFKKKEQVEITIDQPGRYVIDVREIKPKNRKLCVIRSHRKTVVRKTKKPDPEQ